MQLFILDKNPTLASRYLSDCHVIKMCLETAQILSSVCFNRGISIPKQCPKPYNPKHPVIQAIKTPEQIQWVVSYNYDLHTEFLHRFGKPHAYFWNSILYCDLLGVQNKKTSCNDLACDFKDFYTEKSDIVKAHRQYYKYKKSIIKNWKYTNRIEPVWLV